MDSSSNFGLYLLGFVLLIAGVGYGAFLLGVPPVWIGVIILILAGIGVMSAIKRTQGRAKPTE